MNNTGHSDRLPSAIKNKGRIIKRLREGRPAIFLDYDGTLTPIVEDPSKAALADQNRKIIQKLSEHWTVVIMTGRALNDIKQLIGLENLVYAGSHGFNMVGPENCFHEEPGKRFLPELGKAEKQLRDSLTDLKGIRIERKPYAIAVHYRRADENIIPELERRVDEVSGRFAGIAKTTGRKIVELRPNADWNKGKALLYLLKRLHIDDSRTVPLYIGDDTTDEDAFEAIEQRGIGILVTDRDRMTAASHVLQNPEEVTVFLEELVKLSEKVSSFNVWSLTYEGFEPEEEKLREALCTLGNGYFAARGASPESVAGKVHYPGTYIAGIYNRLKSNIAGQTIENESMVNVPNWLALSFRIQNGDWFDLSNVDIIDYRQELDMRQAVLTRTVRFKDKQRRLTFLRQRRFVHMSLRHIAGLETTILPENWSGTIHIRSAIDGRMKNTLVQRYRDLNNHHFDRPETGVTDDRLIWLTAKTNQSHISIAETARTRIFKGNKPLNIEGSIHEEEGYIGMDFEVPLEKEQAIRIEKIVSIYHSKEYAISVNLLESRDALRHVGNFDELIDRHFLAWKHLWERWHIRVKTESNRIEQVLNLHIFHLLQTISPNTVGLDAGVPPRGLHGEAYRGLIMWDELFIFPLLNFRMPDITRALLMYRYNRLPRAYQEAEKAGYSGSMFPWQSGSNGEEQAQTLHLNPISGRWIPDNSQLERHINIAVAYNIRQYYQVTRDDEFMSFYGSEVMVGIARFWASKATYNVSMDRYEICNVMGPDEYHDRYPESSDKGIDNNAYTNVMAAWIFWRTLEMLDMLPDMRRKFIIEDMAITEEEIQEWDRLSRKLRVAFHDDGIISQFEGYEHLKEFDWKSYREKYGNIQRLDRILESENDSPNNYKVSKQADVLMLFYLLSSEELKELFNRLGYFFEFDTIPKNIDYYLNRTSNGSTLSRVVHAWVLSRSKRDMSWRLFQDALESDIEDIQGGTTHEGIHLGAMAGTVDLILRCYSGIESRGNTLWFNPSLPSELKSLDFKLKYHKSWIDVNITGSRITLHSLQRGMPVKIGFKDEIFLLDPGKEMTFVLI
ncbi:MAG: trehalose-phosphatase [Desulfobacterales bacterium]